ncbi:hypothetical protein [Phenylobacterium sp.]
MTIAGGALAPDLYDYDFENDPAETLADCDARIPRTGPGTASGT